MPQRTRREGRGCLLVERRLACSRWAGKRTLDELRRPTWRAAKSDLEVLRDRSAAALQEAQSAKVCVGRASPLDDAAPLRLFDALPLKTAQREGGDGGGQCLVDCAAFAGGLVWALDWCPARRGDRKQSQGARRGPERDLSHGEEFLAVSVHPKGARANRVGVLASGPGLIQIWSVRQIFRPDESAASSLVRPRLALAHDGLVAWDVKWCPDPEGYVGGGRQGDCLSTLGVLAAAFGDGSVNVFCVPRPEDVEEWISDGEGWDERVKRRKTEGEEEEPLIEPPVVAIKPVVTIAKEEMNGSAVSSIDWLPSPPHDLLLLGCWDGYVSIWRMPQGCQSHAEQLLYHRCEHLAIRRAVWLRTSLPLSTADDSHRNTFCTCGHSGKLIIWDARDLYCPIFIRSMTRYWIMDVAASGGPLAVFAGLEDGSVRWLPLEGWSMVQKAAALEHQFMGRNKGAICTVTSATCNCLAAYSGEDGDIVLFQRENEPIARNRKPHFCAAAFKQEGDSLRLLLAEDIGMTLNVYSGGSKVQSMNSAYAAPVDVTLSTPATGICKLQTVWCVQFSPNGNDTTWLASGGSAGILRLQRVSVDC